MLGKLMKHELRATSRIMLPVFLIVLLTSAGANLSTRTLLEINNSFLNTIGMVLLTAFVFAIVGVCLASFIVMLQRFHKNILQDEGYVMMTLPVSVHQLVFSKLLTSIMWYAATVVIVVLAFMILVFDISLVEEMLQSWPEILSALRFNTEAIHVPFFTLELLILVFFSCAGACLQFYSAMSIGHSFANHKMLFSVVVYFGTQFLLQLVIGIFFSVINLTGFDYHLSEILPTFSGMTGIHLLMVLFIVVAIIHAAIFYFLTTYFLSKRLNLE